MTTLTIDMPPALLTWLDVRLTHGDYTDPADYLRDLIRRDRDVFAQREHLRAAIEEGLASGIDERDARTVIDEIIAEDPDLHA